MPNVPKLLDFYLKFTQKILIKLAPILDITSALNELKFVKKIHIVAINNEVKELLFEIEKKYENKILVKTINFNKEKQEVFDFVWNENDIKKDYAVPQQYLYEPNAAILKSGAFDLIDKKFDVSKIQKHSHLYTSKEIIDFPGRIFKIEKCLEYNKTAMKQFLNNGKANITTRNFPETVENIRKKWKISDGGNVYVFFTTNSSNEKIVIICSKV